MSLITQTYDLDIIPGGVPPVVKCSQYDVGRTIVFNILKDGVPYLPNDCTAEVRGTKPDHKGFIYSATPDPTSAAKNVTVELVEQMTCVAGKVLGEVRLKNGSDNIGTANFWLVVEPAGLEDGVDISETVLPEYITAAQRAAERAEAAEASVTQTATEAINSVTQTAQSAISSVNAAKAEVLEAVEQAKAEIDQYGNDAEAWAVGTRDGAPVPATDPTYHNNAKYYGDKEVAILNILPTETVQSRSTISFDDGADDIPVKSLVATLTPFQQGTASPSSKRPITPYTSLTFRTVSKNLFILAAPSVVEKNGLTFTINADGTVLVNGTATAFTSVAVGQALSPVANLLITTGTTGASSSSYRMGFRTNYGQAPIYDTPKVWPGIPGDVMRLSIEVGSGVTMDNVVFKPMIRVYDTSDEFVKGEYRSVEVALGRDVYGGVVDLTNGKLTVTHKLVAMESVNWSRTELSAGFAIYTTSGALLGKGMDDKDVISSMFGTSSATAALANTPNETIRGRATSYNQIVVRYDAVSTVEDFVTAVTGQTMCFALETPEEYTLDPVDLNTLLGLNTVYMTAFGSIDLTYRADIGLYIDKKLAGG